MRSRPLGHHQTLIAGQDQGSNPVIIISCQSHNLPRPLLPLHQRTGSEPTTLPLPHPLNLRRLVRFNRYVRQISDHNTSARTIYGTSARCRSPRSAALFVRPITRSNRARSCTSSASFRLSSFSSLFAVERPPYLIHDYKQLTFVDTEPMSSAPFVQIPSYISLVSGCESLFTLMGNLGCITDNGLRA